MKDVNFSLPSLSHTEQTLDFPNTWPAIDGKNIFRMPVGHP